ncbi:MAG: hypothetical protein EZS28_011152 [Streblomastix strix]|uniref:Ribosomal RNA-processing protein 14/surfeit locus protein 6 C-terminal domain-containing protein n=1 Tax=Streblomastix strix TaxID=222440 RepID=A0A5J4WF37_9EUKA|nr:MAG: hypothetical protein EZS28_011152 [Streblomastix strix]
MAQTAQIPQYMRPRKRDLSKASAEYNPEQRVANYTQIKPHIQSFGFTKDRQQSKPRYSVDKLYIPNYSGIDKHEPRIVIAKQLPSQLVTGKSICNGDYSSDVTYIKKRTPIAALDLRQERKTLQPICVHEDNMYSPIYTLTEQKQYTTPKLGRQAGRDRPVVKYPCNEAIYDDKKMYPNRGVSSFPSISNPRATNASTLTNDLDFLIQHTEQVWRGIDQTLAQQISVQRKKAQSPNSIKANNPHKQIVIEDEQSEDGDFTFVDVIAKGNAADPIERGKPRKKQIKEALIQIQKRDRMMKTDNGKSIAEKQDWDKLSKLAAGEKVKDDPKLLRKALKRIDAKKNKSRKKWNSRMSDLEQAKKEVAEGKRQRKKERSQKSQQSNKTNPSRFLQRKARK